VDDLDKAIRSATASEVRRWWHREGLLWGLPWLSLACYPAAFLLAWNVFLTATGVTYSGYSDTRPYDFAEGVNAALPIFAAAIWTAALFCVFKDRPLFLWLWLLPLTFPLFQIIFSLYLDDVWRVNRYGYFEGMSGDPLNVQIGWSGILCMLLMATLYSWLLRAFSRTRAVSHGIFLSLVLFNWLTVGLFVLRFFSKPMYAVDSLLPTLMNMSNFARYVPLRDLYGWLPLVSAIGYLALLCVGITFLLRPRAGSVS
jgi:hypothetical protein